jgi:hypothetical protein
VNCVEQGITPAECPPESACASLALIHQAIVSAESNG